MPMPESGKREADAQLAWDQLPPVNEPFRELGRHYP